MTSQSCSTLPVLRIKVGESPYYHVPLITHVCLSLASEGSAALGQRHGPALVTEVRPGAAPMLHGEVAQVLRHRDLKIQMCIIMQSR